MPIGLRLDLSKIYSYPVLQSRSAVKSYKELSRTISGHELAWRKGQINTRFFRYDLDQISLMWLSYGAEVEIQASKFQDFSLVQMPLRGTTEIISDGASIKAGFGETVVVTPKNNVRTLWQPGCEQLLIKIPHRLMVGLEIGSGSPTNPEPNKTALISPVYKLDHQITEQWNQLLQQLLTLPVQCDKSPLSNLWLRHFESNIALFLLSHPLHSDNEITKSDYFEEKDLKLNQHVGRLKQIERHIQYRPTEKLSLADLATMAGISVRALHLLCHDHFGLSPMIWLRTIRLDAARKKIQNNPKLSITEIALGHGFEHLGRFSSYYRTRFGELPRKTRSKQ